LIFDLLSVATCVNDESIPEHMKKWLNDLKLKQKKEHRDLLEDDGMEEEEEDDGIEEEEEEEEEEKKKEDNGRDDDRPPAKRMRMSVDAQITLAGNNLLLGHGRVTRSLSRSSRSSSVASHSSSIP